MKDEKKNEEKYPSVYYAYDIAIKSYDWIYRRSEVIDEKIEKLIAWSTGINLAIIALLSSFINNNLDLNFMSFWFIAAIVVFGFGIITGIVSKVSGSLKTISPILLIKKSLHLSEWEFKKNILYRASEDHEYNINYVNRKGRIATFSAISFIIEAVFLMIWFIRLP